MSPAMGPWFAAIQLFPASHRPIVMSKQELRSESRVSVSRKGTLSHGKEQFPCMLQDMSDNGCMLMCTRNLEIGQQLDFECEVYPGKIIRCKLEVMHASRGDVGARVIEIDEESIKLVQLFLQETFSGRLDRYAPRMR
jgi:hypothetical protein